MQFSDSDKLKIQEYFESGQYGIIRRSVGYKTNSKGEYIDVEGNVISAYVPEQGKQVLNPGKKETDCVPKDDWEMVTRPEWRWDLYEYRAYAVVSTFPDMSDTTLQLDPLFVFGYGYQIYYNDAPMGKPVDLYSYSFSGLTVTSAFNSNVLISGDLQALGPTNIIGTGADPDTTLTIVGETHKPSTHTGPKLRFENASGQNHVDLLYSDVGDHPTLTLSSSSGNEVFIVPREQVDNEIVNDEKVETLTVQNAVITNLDVTTLKLVNVADVLYPVGSYYWSTSNIDPTTLFGGTWVQISNTFLYAATYSEPNAQTATHGESAHVLTTDEIPSHNHSFHDPGHTHGIWDPGHSHGVSDPGHMHSIRTIGDDYNGSGRCGCQWGTGNFVQDGWGDMSSENWRRGIWANRSTTDISIWGSGSNIGINWGGTNVSVNACGGGKAHNNMPPYIACYCWHRTA